MKYIKPKAKITEKNTIDATLRFCMYFSFCNKKLTYSITKRPYIVLFKDYKLFIYWLNTCSGRVKSCSSLRNIAIYLVSNNF